MQTNGLRLMVVTITWFQLVSQTDCAPGSTPNIQHIFIGRCLEYQELSKGKLLEPATINCTHLWSLFEKAWAYRDPKSIVQSDYEDFFEAATETKIPEDKVLLWSGTYGIAHQYSDGGRRYVTLEDTLVGYLVNGLTWCGMVCDKCGGINYKECPEFSDLPREANHAFWGGASQKFASGAVGVVKLMVSGTSSDRPAYSKESYFGQFELSALSADVQLQVILVNFLDKIPLEECNTGSLLNLQKDVESRGLSYSCNENPLDILHLLCVNDSSPAQCEMDNPRYISKDLPSLPNVLSGRAQRIDKSQQNFYKVLSFKSRREKILE